MNSPRTVISFVNAAHFLDHYAMLVFAAAVVVMAPLFGLTYSELLPYATPGFIMFGAGSLATGWLGDRWSRRHMLLIYFFGLGLALIATGFARTPRQLGVSLSAIGAFASIYHPVGTAMLVAYASQVGREVGINGVWGNLGVASAAFVTGVLSQFLGWQWAFMLPGAVSMLVGVLFMRSVQHEKRVAGPSTAAHARVPQADMRRVTLALIVTIIGSSTTFNAITVALPKLFAERLTNLTQNTGWLGFIAAAVYVFGALAQFTIGYLLDRRSLKSVFLPMAFLLAPLLMAAASSNGWLLIALSVGIVVGIFGQVTINDTMVAKYTSDHWRSRAFAARYCLGFSAAGVSVALVAWLHGRGGFQLMLQTFGTLSVLVIVGAFIFPNDRPQTR